MTTLHIEHPVTDFAVWQSAFDRFTDARARGGVTGEHIRRPVDDERFVVIDLDFATTDEAHTFLTFLRNTVWSSPQASPALVGQPRTSVLETVLRP